MLTVTKTLKKYLRVLHLISSKTTGSIHEPDSSRTVGITEHQVVQALQIFEVGELDRDRSLLVRQLDGDSSFEIIGDPLLQLE
jgi:hypothetical protein